MSTLAPLQKKHETQSARSAPSAPQSDAANTAAGVPRFLAKPDPAVEEQANRAGELTASAPTLGSINEQTSVNVAQVRLHSDEAAHQFAQRQGARAVTSGNDIYFNRGELNPSSAGGRALIGHEMAHVGQQHAGQTRGMQRKPLSDAPESARQKLALPSAPTTIPSDSLKAFFEKQKNGWGTTRPAPKGVKVELQGIQDEYKTPMTSVAIYMYHDLSYASTVSGLTQPLFGPGVSLTLQLALAKHGLADARYRFSWTGDEQSGTIYIESTAAGPKAENSPSESGGTITVGGLTFEAVGSWPAERMGYLKRALGLMPLAALKEVDKLKFRVKSGSGSAGEEGAYDDDKHTVSLYASAFSTSDARYGESPKAVQELVHEIGHAVDMAPLRKAWQQYQNSGKAGGLKSVASPSGSKWAQDKSKTWQMAERLSKRDVDFRKAAEQDGVGTTKTTYTDASGAQQTIAHLKGGISDYSNTNWTELFAESFALYTTDPESLRLLRPNLYSYFVKRYPRKDAMMAISPQIG